MTSTHIPLAVKRIASTLLRDTDASEIVEAALVLPLMFTVLLGIFWFGQAFSIYGTITRAAQEGGLAGAKPACATCTGTAVSQNTYNAIQDVLTNSNLDINSLQQPTPIPSLNSCIDNSPVICDTSFAHVCIQKNIQLSSTVGGAAGVCGISVTFNYPYQFRLPFTSLNKQIVPISAAAQVPMETR